MMDSLRSATRHTMFDQWLDATLRPMPDPAAATVQEEQPQVCQSLVHVQPGHPDQGSGRQPQRSEAQLLVHSIHKLINVLPCAEGPKKVDSATLPPLAWIG